MSDQITVREPTLEYIWLILLELHFSLKGHDAPVNALALSPEGDKLLSGGIPVFSIISLLMFYNRRHWDYPSVVNPSRAPDSNDPSPIFRPDYMYNMDLI